MLSTTGSRALPRCLHHLAKRTPSLQSINNNVAIATSSTRSYITRAHPSQPKIFPAPEAFQLVLEQIEARKAKRAKRAANLAKKRATLAAAAEDDTAAVVEEEDAAVVGVTATATAVVEDAEAADDVVEDDTPPVTSDASTTTDDASTSTKWSPQDETIDLAINLNVDPRKPGQSLRGSLELPHGTGRKVAVVVFTSDAELASQAKEMGALHVGGDELMDQIKNGDVSVDSFQRALATSEVIPDLSKKLARVLGPRGLMPNRKVGTVAPPDQLLELLESQLAGKEVQYRTEKEGIMHVPVGKGSFGLENLLNNTGAVMKKIHEMRPETYGKAKKGSSGGGGGKKKGGGAKTNSKDTAYVLSAYVSSTFGKGYKVDLRTLDPSSAFFLKNEID